MGSLTSCAGQFDKDLRAADKTAIYAGARKYRADGMEPTQAAIQAVKDQQAVVDGLIAQATKAAKAALKGDTLPSPQVKINVDHVGQDNTPLSEGGQPFKTQLAASTARKLQPDTRVVRVDGGYALAPKTEKQIAAQALAGRRLSAPNTSPAGEAIPAHAFIAAEGGLNADTYADMNVGSNPVIRNRRLFAGGGRGLSMEQATERLIEEGYLDEGAGQNEAMALIKRSLTNPQYTPEGVELMAEKESKQRADAYDAEQLAIALAEEAKDNQFADAADAYEAAMLGQPTNDLQSDMSREDAFLAMGFTEQEYKNALTEESSRPQSSGQSDNGIAQAATGEGAQSDSGRERTPGSLQGQDDGLTAPTEAEILAQQERAAQGERAAKAKRLADAELDRRDSERKDIAKASEAAADSFVLGGDAEQNLSGQGGMFDAPAKPDAVAEKAEIRPFRGPDGSVGYEAVPIRSESPVASANTIFTKDAADAARARLKSKLGRLNSGIDPETLMDGITLAGYHIENGARTFAAYAKAMLDDLGDGVKPYLKSWYAGVAYDPRASSFKGMDSMAVMDAFDVDSLTKPAPDAIPVAPSAAKTLSASLAESIARGEMPKDNPALRKLVQAFDGNPVSTARMKEAQEALEAAIARRAREIVAKGDGVRETYYALLALYASQPSLNIRTSTSITNQAYSTPAPLAYLASELAGITQKTTVLEPTAGTGMLLIGAKPGNTSTNELDPKRVALLQESGYKPTNKDASTGFKGVDGAFDAIITNPPFGSIKDAQGNPTKVLLDGFKIGQIDHLIAANALIAMKDNGKATLILGANQVTGGLSTNDRIFFNWLYSHYNVTGHFEVNGDLYSRQGAGWPVRVISIDGRANSKSFSPIAGTIQRVDTWKDVYDQFNQIIQRAGEPASGIAPTEAGRPQAPIVAPGATGQGRPSGGTSSPGNVAGTSTGNVPNQPKPAGPGVAPVRDEQRLNAQSALPPANPAGVPGNDPKPVGDRRPGKPAGTAAVTTPPEVSGNEFQVPYTPRSARKDEGVLIPSNMADPLRAAMSRLEDEVGDIDEFARKELGYSTIAELHDSLMGLQVDSVAMSIHQMKQGKAVVIADQTGIGKGRQAAAIIRWAQRSGYTPVFVSVKPSLFTDMYGDLADIGTNNINPFIMNTDAWVSAADGGKLFANKSAQHSAAIQKIASTGELPAGRNAVFMTYSQINKANKQRAALTSLAPNAVFVLDESHNAAGKSATAQFMIETLEQSKAVTYLSATYAKRPDNMALYFKTDIGAAAADTDGLAAAMASGGLPLQTVVSNNLVKAGQMFRRERSYNGVSIESKTDTANRAKHEALSDTATMALRSILDADRSFHGGFVKNLAANLKKEGATVKDNAGNQIAKGVEHTEFSSVVHNFVKQMLLGLKAQTAANEAIASLKRGEKPIIAVENTMGSFLAEYAESNRLKPGDLLNGYDYRTVLSRALARTRVITEVDPQGNNVKRDVPLAELDAYTRQKYDQAQSVIDALTLSIPASPIDWMRAEITKAGYSIAEITGRNLSVDYTDAGNTRLSAIDALEQSDKVNTTRQFNSGKLDALILNVAGSTGISLHASEKFTDQRQRYMIVAQAAGDINVFMQMLGRIHRTGQVVLPKYAILSVALPTEKRPTAVLSGKMKSLNANTSSNTESATSVKTLDILNKYGDQVVHQFMEDNMELARALDVEDKIGSEPTDDIARMVTGRLALQPIVVQNAFYEEVESQYSALIDYLNKTNQNELEPRTFDFDARETRQEVLFDGPNKNSPFGEDAIYGEYSIKAQGTAMTPAEITAAMAENLEGKTAAVHVQGIVDKLLDQFNTYLKTLPEGAQQATAPAQMSAVRAFMLQHAIGKTFRIDINSEPFNAVVTNIRSTHKSTGNPFALSKVQLTVSVNGAMRSLSVPATQFRKIEVSAIGNNFSVAQLFKEQPANQREIAKIITGNLLAAYGEIEGSRGTIISFSKADNTIEQGILLPKVFDYKKNTRGDYRLETASAALTFLQNSDNRDIGRFGIMSRDSVLRVLPSGQGVTIVVPKSQAKGAKYFLDAELLKVTGDFASSGQNMRATVESEAKAIAALDLVMKKQALYALPSMAEEAKEMVGKTGGAPSFSRTAADTVRATGKQDAVQAYVNSITSKWFNAPKVVVVRDMQDTALPERIRQADAAALTNGAEGTPEGVFYQGTVYLIASQINTRDQAFTVLAHEALGHFGLRGMFGTSLDAVKNQIATLRSKEVMAKGLEYGLAMTPTLARKALGAGATTAEIARLVQKAKLYAAEEVLAEMAQKTPNIGFVQRAVAAIRTWLRENVPSFNSLALTDNEITRSFILPARGFVMRGENREAFGGVPAFRRSADNQTVKSASFKKWFGDSKVVDAAGVPMVMYHGTNKSESGDAFSRFDTYGSNYGLMGQGSYFTNNPEVASSYTKKGRGESPSIYPVFLSVKNPIDMDARAESGSWEKAFGEVDFEQNQPEGAKNEDYFRVVEEHFSDQQIPKYEGAEIIQDGLRAMGHDGVTHRGGVRFKTASGISDTRHQVYIAFDPAQIKSATGNNGDFDGGNDNIMFSRTLTGALNSVKDMRLPAGYVVNDMFSKSGKIGLWHKTVGTQYNLAQRNPVFKPVYDGVQNFINDVSLYATEAADLAPNILPKLDTWKDITKSPLTAADNKAIARPIFEGTLNYGRNEAGKLVQMSELEEAAFDMSPLDKSQQMLRKDLITESVLKMWRGLPVEQHDRLVNSRYAAQMLQPGAVFTPEELKTEFGLTDGQIKLYQEFRGSIDKSVSQLALSDIVRFGGEDLANIRDEIMQATTVEDGAVMARDYLMSLTEGSTRPDQLLDIAGTVIDKVDKARALMNRGYAPLSRFGQYSLDVVDKNGERAYFGLFESKAEAAKMARSMAIEFPGAAITRGTTSEEAYKLFAGVSPETLELFGEMLGLEAQGDSASAKAFQDYLKLAKSSRSAMKRLIRRKGIAGFSQDPGRVLAGFIYSNSRQISGGLNMRQIDQSVNAIPQGMGELKDHASKLRDYIKNPQQEGQAIRGLLFTQYLGGSIASAMVNMTQPFTMTLPYLAQFGGVANSVKVMTAAVGDVMKKKTGDAKLDAALKLAEEKGIVAPQEVHQLMAQANGAGSLRPGDGTTYGDAAAKASNGLARLSLVWGKLFSSAEQFNRRVTFIAAYRIAMAQNIKNPEAFATKAIDETQGVYNKGNKPAWARGAVGGLLFTFKQYSVAYLELAHRMATQGGPEGKKAALLMAAVLMLVGGMGGLPFVEDVEDIVDGIVQRLGYNFSAKQKRNEFLTELLGKDLARFIEGGLSGLPGAPIDVSGRMGMKNLIPGTGLFLKKNDYTNDVLELAGPGADLVKRGFQAANALAGGDVGKAVTKLLPTAASNLAKSVDMYNSGIYKDQRGRKVIDVDGYDALAKGIGFQPNDVAQVQDATRTVQNMIGQNKLREAEIADKWALALFNKDPDGVAAARDMLRDWNEKNPVAPIGIQMPQIVKRVRAMNESKQERIAKTSPKEIRSAVRRELAGQ